MNSRFSLAALAALLLPAAGFSQYLELPAPYGTDAYQVNYVSNLDKGDGTVNITNAGTSAGNNVPIANSNTFGDICANVYVYAPDQQLATCCSCVVSPNSIHSWPVSFGTGNLLSTANDTTTLASIANGNHSVVLKLLASVPGSGDTCNPASPGTLAGGMVAWATHSHPTNTPTVAITETTFEIKGLSVGEFGKLTGDCQNFLTRQSGTQCPNCRLGGLDVPSPSL